MKANKTLIAGAALGGVAGAYIATHQKEIKAKVKETIKAIADAGMAKLKGTTAEIKAVVLSSKKVATKKINKAVKKSS